jgi:hypothetical protein
MACLKYNLRNLILVYKTDPIYIKFYMFFFHICFETLPYNKFLNILLGVSKKIKKPIKPRKPEKNNRKNRTVKKNHLKFWKNRPIRFRFYNPETKKTEPNPNRKKPEKNRAKPEKIKPKPSQNQAKPKNQIKSKLKKNQNQNRTENNHELFITFFFQRKKESKRHHAASKYAFGGISLSRMEYTWEMEYNLFTPFLFIYLPL